MSCWVFTSEKISDMDASEVPRHRVCTVTVVLGKYLLGVGGSTVTHELLSDGTGSESSRYPFPLSQRPRKEDLARRSVH